MSIKDMYNRLVRDGLIKEINYSDMSLSNMDICALREFEEAIDAADTLKEQLEELQEEYDELFEERDDLESERNSLEEELEDLKVELEMKD